METIKQLDQSLLLFLNSFHNAYWDKAVTIFTSTDIWIPFYLLIIYFIVKTYKRNSIYILILIALAIVISDQFSGLIKHSVERLRPTHDPLIGNMIHNVYNRGGSFGFFSAHAANTFSLAIILTKLFKNQAFSILIFIWAILVSYTRVYLGLHYPADILVGWIWGFLTGFAIYQIMIIFQKRYFAATSPDISKTSGSKQDLKQLSLFVIIYVLTILMTINRLTKFQFFSS